ncbi:MAG: carboxymuconolactone decarboxylase family protein [candidate division Zixibacteria bacterium]|nr:carboxymuconolactone decarboxylase family protein [candidate division Zixibacteria bacterium]
MTTSAQLVAFRDRLSTFSPKHFANQRWVALYAAGIALADPIAQEAILRRCNDQPPDRRALYEVVLQSYLFLGFPRMLTAAEILENVLPGAGRGFLQQTGPGDEVTQWQANGLALCKKVYGESFEPLRIRVEAIAPEIFRWMILEGYGKVLSRPGLGMIERELANVAMLVIDDREQQLHSHLRGAINVGASPDLLKTVVDDLRGISDGFETARRLLVRMKVL